MSESSLPPVNDEARRADEGEPSVHDELRYEEPDIGVGGIIAVLAGIAVLFVAVAAGCWWLLARNESEADRAAEAPQYSRPAERMPAAPRLEPLERGEVAADTFVRQLDMERVLQSFGDTAEQGFVHIPIEQAMKLAVETMPARQDSERLPEMGFGLVGGGEANSGRLYSEGPTWLQQK
jgi:hypothetical protein